MLNMGRPVKSLHRHSTRAAASLTMKGQNAYNKDR